MNSVTPLWLTFITRPLWVHAAVQVCLIGIGALLGYYGFIQKERDLAADIQQRAGVVAAETVQITQRLQALPSLSALTHPLSLLRDSTTRMRHDGIAALLAQPLAQSGVTLISLQQHHQFATMADNTSRDAVSPIHWILLVSTDYRGALILLRQILALSSPLHIHSLAIRTKDEALQVEITLSLPRVSEDNRA